MKTEKIVLGVAGLAGLYLLTRQIGDPSGGGGLGGLAGDDENGLGDTIINFPDLDLSKIWGDSPEDPAYVDSLMAKKDIYQADPSNPLTTSEGLIRTTDLSSWVTAQYGSIKGTPTLNIQSTPYSITDPVKKQSYEHHGGLKLPGAPKESYYTGPGATPSQYAATKKKNIIEKGYSF